MDFDLLSNFDWEEERGKGEEEYSSRRRGRRRRRRRGRRERRKRKGRGGEETHMPVADLNLDLHFYLIRYVDFERQFQDPPETGPPYPAPPPVPILPQFP